MGKKAVVRYGRHGHEESESDAGVRGSMRQEKGDDDERERRGKRRKRSLCVCIT